MKRWRNVITCRRSRKVWRVSEHCGKYFWLISKYWRYSFRDISKDVKKWFNVVDPRKLDLRRKYIILLSRIAILLLKGYFGRENINFHENNLKYRNNNFINKFYFCLNFFSYRFLPNFKKLSKFNKRQITFSRKRFPIFENE